MTFWDFVRLLLLFSDYDGRREFAYPRLVRVEKLAPFSAHSIFQWWIVTFLIRNNLNGVRARYGRAAVSYDE